MNPVDWVAFLYGRIFQNHPYVGGTMVTVAFAVFGLLLWLRGVDKYKSEHPKSAQASVAPSESPTGQVNQEKKPEVQGPRVEKINKPPARPQVTQNAPGGINIGGDNFGSATVNNYGPAPVKPLDIEENQANVIAESLRAFSGQSVEIFLVGDRTQTETFGSRLRATLAASGLNVTLSAAGILIRGNGAPPPPGISISVGDERRAIAEALGTVLRQQGIIDEPLGGLRAGKPEEFKIYIVPPK